MSVYSEDFGDFDITEENVVELLSRQEVELNKASIGPDDTIRITPFSLRSFASEEVNAVNMLPQELWTMIVNHMDVRTIGRFGATCQRNYITIIRNQAYREVMRYAQGALSTLCATGLITRHSLGRIHSVLTSTHCVSCGKEFAPYLFVITFERACVTCLMYNQALWVMPLTLAERCFGLRRGRVHETLVSMKGLLGRYTIRRRTRYQRTPVRLVSVREAKELAVRIFGSEQALIDNAPRPRPGPRAESVIEAYDHYLQTPLRPLGFNPLLRPAQDLGLDGRHDPYFGMATMRFPSLTSRGLDGGYWCLGCLRHLFDLEIWLHEVLNENPPNVDALKATWRQAQSGRFVAYSREKFLEHVQVCEPAKSAEPVLRPWFIAQQEAALANQP